MPALKYVEITVYSVVYDPVAETYESTGSAYIRESKTAYNWVAKYLGRDWVIGFEEEPKDHFLTDYYFTKSLMDEIKNVIGHVDLPMKRVVTLEI